MTETRSGILANRSGNLLETTVKEVLIQRGFTILPYRDWKNGALLTTEDILLTRCPFESIYNHPGHTEFIVKSKRYHLDTRIECKWQQVSGSVDEKLPYLYLNCIENMPEDHIILIIDGKGWKEGAIQWLKTAVKEKRYTNPSNSHKHIDIFQLTEFISWVNTTLR